MRPPLLMTYSPKKPSALANIPWWLLAIALLFVLGLWGITADGTYSPEAFKMDIHIKTISGMNLAGSMDAKRVSAECAPEEKPAEKAADTAAK